MKVRKNHVRGIFRMRIRISSVRSETEHLEHDECRRKVGQNCAKERQPPASSYISQGNVACRTSRGYPETGKGSLAIYVGNQEQYAIRLPHITDACIAIPYSVDIRYIMLPWSRDAQTSVLINSHRSIYSYILNPTTLSQIPVKMKSSLCLATLALLSAPILAAPIQATRSADSTFDPDTEIAAMSGKAREAWVKRTADSTFDPDTMIAAMSGKAREAWVKREADSTFDPDTMIAAMSGKAREAWVKREADSTFDPDTMIAAMSGKAREAWVKA